MGFSEFKTWRDMSKVPTIYRIILLEVHRVMRCNNVRTWELNSYSQRTPLRNINFLPRWSLCLIYFGVVVQIVRMKKTRKASINIEAKWGTDLRGNCSGAEIYGHHRFPIYLECGRPWPPPSLESLLLHELFQRCSMSLCTSTSVNLVHTDFITHSFRVPDLGQSSNWTVWVLSSLS